MLRVVAVAVPKKDVTSRKIRSVISKMKSVLAQEEHGVAIAAPQIGEPLRLFVISGSVFKEGPEDERAHPYRVFINPTLTRLSKKKVEMSEGCLSVRGKYGVVPRHEKATIKALDEQGRATTYHGTGLVGHIFQHECDHLDGILYVDKATRLEKDEDMKSARVRIKEKHGL